ncbi:MAG: type VI secretion system lipoprotein TssJ [Pseudomonadota bacterium]
MLAWASALPLVIAPAACSHDPPPPAATPKAEAAAAPCPTPEPLRVSVAGSSRLNPGEKGEALATVVRLYQLKGINKLMGVSFDDLLDHDKEALADDFVGVQEITINPGERLEPSLTRAPETNYLMAVALFRQPAGTTWKVVKKLSPPDPNHCHVAVDGAQGSRANNAPRLFLDENRIELR